MPTASASSVRTSSPAPPRPASYEPAHVGQLASHHSSTRWPERSRLTAQLQQELGEAVELGCSAREESLRRELVTVNMPVARAISRRYRFRGISAEDLEQVAYLALTKASQRFDPTAGHAFLTFSVPTIRGEVRRHFRDRGWMVRPPRHLQEVQQRVLTARADLMQRTGHSPTASEVARFLELPPEEVREALDQRGAFTPTSLDQPVSDSSDSCSLGDLLGEVDHTDAAAEARVILAPAVRTLSERDRRILGMRFLDGLTQREIAEEIGVTQMQVSRLLTRIFRDLRCEIGRLE